MEYEHHPEWVEAWKKGKTGIPLVDACMAVFAGNRMD
jgi:deoxyribodipyrimidine photolyase